MSCNRMVLRSPHTEKERAMAFLPATAGDGRVLLMFSLESDPEALWPRFADLSAKIEGAGLGRIMLAAPFIAAPVGVDPEIEDE